MRLTPELEATLRRYVRGDLEETLRLELEELLLTDPDAFEALGVVEDELIGEYVEGEGSTLERKGFEEHFLTSPERRGRLVFLQALRARAVAAAQATREEAPTVPEDRDRSSGRRPSWIEAVTGSLRSGRWQPAWGALGATLALSLAGNAWLAWRQLAPLEPAAPAVPSIALSPGLLRAEGTLPRVVVPPGAAGVQLVLELPGNDYPLYRVTLVDDEGNEIWTASRLQAQTAEGRAVIALVVPAALLPHSDYRVQLSGIKPPGEPEELSSSPFRVNVR
jgi:anti-sigma factor RsiW